MSNKPVEKLWGYLKKRELEEILKNPSAVKKHEKYGEQILIQAAKWESGNITVQFWDKESNKNIDVLVLRPDSNNPVSVDKTDDNESDFAF